jgi:hypothetical protein
MTGGGLVKAHLSLAPQTKSWSKVCYYWLASANVAPHYHLFRFGVTHFFANPDSGHDWHFLDRMRHLKNCLFNFCAIANDVPRIPLLQQLTRSLPPRLWLQKLFHGKHDGYIYLSLAAGPRPDQINLVLNAQRPAMQRRPGRSL